MSFSCDLIFSYSNKREYIGLLNFRNVVTMQVQHVYDAMASSGTNPTGMPPLWTGAYTGIVVNGVNFGTGRIISYSNPTSTDITENGRHLWKQIVNVEVYESGDLSNISTDPAVVGLLQAYSTNLASLDESYAFDMLANGDYQYTHSAAVKCINDPTGGPSGYITAQKIASGLLSSTPPFGYIDSVHSGFYNTSGKRLYTENTDVFNGSVNFEEKFLIQSRDFVKHTVNFDNGFCNITESAVLRHSGVSTADSVFNGDPLSITTRYNTAYNGAYTRCNSLYSTYATVLGTDPYTVNLATQPVSLTKSFDERSQELTYTVVYTNNPNLTTNGYTVEREQSISQNNFGIVEAAEQTNIVAYAFKDPSLYTFLANAIATEIANSQNRLIALWSNVSSFKKDAESKTVSVRGKRASFSVNFTNDPSFLNDGTFLTKTRNIQDNEAILMHSPYFIVGQNTPLIHNPGQTQFGNVTCTISANLLRPVGYYAGTPYKPSIALNAMFSDALNNVLLTISPKAPIDIYVSKILYSYNSDLSAEVSVEAQYVYAKLTRT